MLVEDHLLVLSHGLSLAETQPQLLAPCQVSDHSQTMCGGPEVDMLLSST